MRDRTNPQIELTLWRHGETAANKERRYLGKTDEGLSEEGKRLAEAAAGQLRQRIASGKAKAPGQIFVSPMLRCLQSAQLLYPDVPAVIIPEWEEMDFGEFEYKNYEELKSDARYQAWIDSGGTLPFPGGESREQFIARCKKGYERMRLSIRDDAESIGIVAHGGTLMALLSAYGGGDYFDYQTGCASGFVCTMEADGRLTNICSNREKT